MSHKTQAISRQTRLAKSAEFRVVGDGDAREFIARVLTYNTVDDYGTVWLPGCFDASLAERMPVVAWAHQWTEPIGRYVEVVRNDDEVLELLGRLDDFDDVPRARQAYSQFKSGTLDQFSVGFTRQKWSIIDDPDSAPAGAREEMIQALLDEVSPVLVGAVQGTSLLAVRAAGKVDIDQVVELARRVKAGELTHEEADEALTLLAGEPPAGAVEPPPVEDVTPPADDAEVTALLEEADAVLARSRR